MGKNGHSFVLESFEQQLFIEKLMQNRKKILGIAENE